LRSLFIEIFRIGRRPHVTTPHLPTPVACVVSAPPSEPLQLSTNLPARANVPARGVVLAARRTRPQRTRDKVRAPNDRCPERSAARLILERFGGETRMTAYLISLALAGLIALALWEAFA